METITVWRGLETTDAYGNPVQGVPEPWGAFLALVAPNHPEESVEVGRHAVITGYTIYIEGTAPTGILDSDLIEVRTPEAATGSTAERRKYLLPVEGKVASWYRRDGSYRGDQLAVRVVNG